MSTRPSGRRPFAIVTGASSGIGLELSKQFADNGFDVVVNSASEGINTAAQQLQRTGRR